MYYLSLCAMFKSEHDWLEEWLEYHLHLGVEHFYLVCDDLASDRERSKEILRPYMERGVVTMFDNPFGDGILHQTYWYGEAAIRYVNATKWMGFLDLDEFILPSKTDDIRNVLENYEEYDALGISWVNFGTSGYLENPPGQINHLLYRSSPEFRMNRFVKSIVQLEYFENSALNNAHVFQTKRTPTVDPHQRVIREMAPEFRSEDIIRINHYVLRSRDWYFNVKSKRGEYVSQIRDMNFWIENERNDLFEDEISQRFGHVVRDYEKNGAGKNSQASIQEES